MGSGREAERRHQVHPAVGGLQSHQRKQFTLPADPGGNAGNGGLRGQTHEIRRRANAADVQNGLLDTPGLALDQVGGSAKRRPMVWGDALRAPGYSEISPILPK